MLDSLRRYQNAPAPYGRSTVFAKKANHLALARADHPYRTGHVWYILRSGRGSAYQAYVVSYADNFVILSRRRAEEAMAWTRQVITRLGLTLSEDKTSVRNARQERFDFLGYAFGPHQYRKDSRWYLGASPLKKSVQRLKHKVGEIWPQEIRLSIGVESGPRIGLQKGPLRSCLCRLIL